MNTETERRLHDRLTELGTIEPPVAVADGALRRAGRMRRRNIAAMATGVAAVLAIAVAVPMSLHHSGHAPAGNRPPPVTKLPPRNLVVAYHSFAGQQGGQQGDAATVVLDPKTGKYVQSRVGFDLIASPDGQRYAAYDGTRIGTAADAVAGKDRAFRQLNIGTPGNEGASWSADSTRLLIPVDGQDGNLAGFRIYDVDTNTLGPLAHLPKAAPGGSRSVVWGAGDKSVVTLDEDSASKDRQVRFFDLTGVPGKTIELPAAARNTAGTEQISPDGTYLVQENGALLNLKTGQRNSPQLPGSEPGAATIVGWRDSRHYVVAWTTKSGLSKDRRLLVLDNSGKLTRSLTPPLGTAKLPKTHGKYEWIATTLGAAAGFPTGSGFRL